MTEPPRRRGRPRAYSPDVALARARDVFWDAGYAATSLDALAAATAMNRPSLYGAFGDKQALYLKALARYRDDSLAELRLRLDPSRPLREGLADVYATAIAAYTAGEAGPRGCLLIGTAGAEAVQNPEVRSALHDALRSFEAVLDERIRLGAGRGETSAVDPSELVLLASAVLHSLAVRARAGEPRATLEALARAGVAAVCGHA